LFAPNFKLFLLRTDDLFAQNKHSQMANEGQLVNVFYNDFQCAGAAFNYLRPKTLRMRVIL